MKLSECLEYVLLVASTSEQVFPEEKNKEKEAFERVRALVNFMKEIEKVYE